MNKPMQLIWYFSYFFIFITIISYLSNNYPFASDDNLFSPSTINEVKYFLNKNNIINSTQSQLDAQLDDPNADPKVESKWDSLSEIATLIAAFAAVVAAVFAAKNIKLTSIEMSRNRDVNEAQIYLSLRDLFSKHEEVQKNLKGGKWNERDQGPITESNPGEELAKVDSYLRFFEYCYILIKIHIIEETKFKDMYESYIHDIKRNYQIMQIIDEEGWPLFKELLERLDKKII
jgi:hypothetical protein